METTMLRISQVASLTGLSRASIYNAIDDGTFTKPVAIGPRSMAWPAYEIEEINRARVRGFKLDQVRELVQRLHDKRNELTHVE